jgi:hypothetical protein
MLRDPCLRTTNQRLKRPSAKSSKRRNVDPYSSLRRSRNNSLGDRGTVIDYGTLHYVVPHRENNVMQLTAALVKRTIYSSREESDSHHLSPLRRTAGQTGFRASFPLWIAPKQPSWTVAIALTGLALNPNLKPAACRTGAVWPGVSGTIFCGRVRTGLQ